MTIFVYEYMTAMAAERCEPSLKAEGWAMLERLLQDLSHAEAPLVTFIHKSRQDYHLPCDCRLVETGEPIDRMLDESTPQDQWFLIAPESDGILSGISSACDRRGILHHGLPTSLINLFTDKLRTYDELGGAVLPTYDSVCRLDAHSTIVVKPRDGCGSMHVAVAPRSRIDDAIDRIRASGFAGELVFQPFVEGKAASIAAIGNGIDSPQLLPLVEQVIVNKTEHGIDWLHYEGGRIGSIIDSRAADAVKPLLEILPPFEGYLGFDLVLPEAGPARIVDINPCLTTSYVGYSEWMRKASGRTDLMAELMLGNQAEIPAAGPRLAFTAAGLLTEG